MKRIRTILAAALLVLGMGFALAAPAAVSADDAKSVVCDSIGAGTDCSKDPSNGTNVNNLVKLIINTLSLLIGVVAVIMIMVSGFKYITANGDANKVSSAKNTLIYALIGLVVAALAQVLVQFVLNKALTTPPAKEEAKQAAFIVQGGTTGALWRVQDQA